MRLVSIVSLVPTLAIGCYSPRRPLDHDDMSESGSTTAPLDTSGASATSPSTSSSASTITDTTRATSESTDDPTGASTTSTEGCGNGVMEATELCDDGDGIDGNGCNNDCTPSGTEIWTVIYDGAAGLDDRVSDLAVASDDSIVVVGYEGAQPYDLALTLRYDADGAMIWQQTFGAGEATGVAISMDDDIVVSAHDATAFSGTLIRLGLEGGVEDEIAVAAAPFDIGIDERGVVYACGRVGVLPDPWHAWVALYSEYGSVLWEFHEYEGMQSQHLRLALVPTAGAVLLGVRDDTMTLERRDAQGERSWLRSFGDVWPGGVAAWNDGRSAVAASQDDNASITLFDDEGTIAWMDAPDLGQSSGGGVAIDLAGNVVLVGGVEGGNAFGSDAFAAKYNPSGTLLWSQHWDVFGEGPANATYASTVSIASDDSIVVAGNAVDADASRVIWIRKSTP